MARKKLTKTERAERDARHERVLANAQRTRELAEQASREVRGAGEAEWMERLAEDYDNFSAALEWARESNPAGLLELAAPLGWFWWLRGRFSEAGAGCRGRSPRATKRQRSALQRSISSA